MFDILTRNKKQEQLCLIWQEDDKINKERKPIKLTNVVDAKAMLAWFKIHKLLLPLKGTNRLVLLLSPRNAIPLDPFNLLTDEEKERLTKLDDADNILDSVADASCAYEMSNIEKASQTDKIASSLQFSVSLIFLLICIIVVLILTGKIPGP